MTSGPDEDLPTLISRKDHVNILRYVRAHQLREPDLVIAHAIALLGDDLQKKLGDESIRLAALEQTCLAALDAQDHTLAEKCLSRLRDAVGKEALRFRMLLARCLESAGDKEGSKIIYDDLLKGNPGNLMALKRLYCLSSTEKEAVDSLNNFIQQNTADPSGWYEMVKLRFSMGDFKGASYALEEVVLGCPLDSTIHCQLGEVYATLGGIENLLLARKHLAQSLELDDGNLRAVFSLVSTASDYLQATQGKKDFDEHEAEVAKELVKYGADKVIKSYKGSTMYKAVQHAMAAYTEGLLM